MVHLVSTTNNVRLSFLLALLRDAGIKAHVFDANISALEAFQPENSECIT